MKTKTNHPTAADAWQEAYLDTQQTIKAGTFIMDMEAYIYRIAKRIENKGKEGGEELSEQTLAEHGESPEPLLPTSDELDILIEGKTEQQRYLIKLRFEVIMNKGDFDRWWRQLRDDLKRWSKSHTWESTLADSTPFLVEKATKLPTIDAKKTFADNEKYYQQATTLLRDVQTALQKGKAVQPDSSEAWLEELVRVGRKIHEVRVEQCSAYTYWLSAAPFASGPYSEQLLVAAKSDMRKNAFFVIEAAGYWLEILRRKRQTENDSNKQAMLDQKITDLLQEMKLVHQFLAAGDLPAVAIHGDAREVRLDWWFFEALHRNHREYATINAANTQYKKAVKAVRRQPGNDKQPKP